MLREALDHAQRLTTDSEIHTRGCRTALRDLYRAWHEADPTAGHDGQADELDSLLKKD